MKKMQEKKTKKARQEEKTKKQKHNQTGERQTKLDRIQNKQSQVETKTNNKTKQGRI